MRDSMQFDGAIPRYTIYEYTTYPLKMREIKQITESHKYLHLTPVDGSSVKFPLLLKYSIFSNPPRPST